MKSIFATPPSATKRYKLKLPSINSLLEKFDAAEASATAHSTTSSDEHVTTLVLYNANGPDSDNESTSTTDPALNNTHMETPTANPAASSSASPADVTDRSFHNIKYTNTLVSHNIGNGYSTSKNQPVSTAFTNSRSKNSTITSNCHNGNGNADYTPTSSSAFFGAELEGSQIITGSYNGNSNYNPTPPIPQGAHGQFGIPGAQHWWASSQSAGPGGMAQWPLPPFMTGEMGS